MSESIPKHWFAGDPFRTHLFNSFSISVPESERFLAATAKLARLGLRDNENLTRTTDTLIHEEEAHTKVHEAYNDLLKRQGYAIGSFENSERRLAVFLSRRSLETRLALCLCGEFFTALMGRHLITTRVCESEGVDERMRELWTWHSLEELEHRGSVYDLYLAYGGGYVRRVLSMLFIAFFYLAMQINCFLFLLRTDNARLTLREWGSGINFLFGKHGFYRHVFIHWFVFLKPGFHPTRDVRLPKDVGPELSHAHIEDRLAAALR